MRALINALIVHLTLNIIFFLKGWNAFQNKKYARVILSIILGLEFFSYLTVFIFYKNLSPNLTQTLRFLGTSWMLFLLYTCGIWLIIDLTYIIYRRIKGKPWKYSSKTLKNKIYSFLLPIVFVLIVMVIGNYKFRHPVIKHIPITINKTANNLDSLKIAFFADVHLGWMINETHLDKIIKLVDSQNPDIILIGGDIIDSQIQPVIDRQMINTMKKINAPLGVYACPGNHEYRFEREEKFKLINKSGIKMLRDSAVLIDSAFYIIGREDKIIENRLSLENIKKKYKINPDLPLIVLNHTPDNLSEEADAKADLALYGHTHHGQAFPGNIATDLTFEIAHGQKTKNNTNFYVTSGIGLVGPQYRIGTVSEIVIFDIKFN